MLGTAAEATVRGIAVLKTRPLVLIYSVHFCSFIVFGVLVSNYPETQQRNNGSFIKSHRRNPQARVQLQKLERGKREFCLCLAFRNFTLQSPSA